jgi:hypothetical protein
MATASLEARKIAHKPPTKEKEKIAVTTKLAMIGLSALFKRTRHFSLSWTYACGIRRSATPEK